jgi:plasmid-related protein
MYDLKKIIEIEGPKLSSELIALIVENDKVSEETARKRLSRLKDPINRIKGLFSDNQTFFYHKKIYKKPEFYDALIESLELSGKKYYAIINSIQYHYGSINKDRLPAFSFSPTKNLKGHKRIDTMIRELIDLEIIYDNGNNYELNSKICPKENHQHSKSLEIVENFLLNQLNDWARGIGLTSYNTATYYSEFGKFSWAYVSPSYVSTLVKYNKGNIVPGFVVADVLIGNTKNEVDIDFFLKKIEVLRSITTMPTFLPFLVTDYLNENIFRKLKTKGIIIALVDKMFGHGYKELIEALINSITNAGAILKNNPQSYLNLIDSINSLAIGKTNNLRGDLFEMAVGYYHGQKCKSLNIGKIINFQGKQREIDVLAVYENKVVIAECKGYKSKISKDEMEQWVSEKIYLIRYWLNANEAYAQKEFVFEHWSTGGYTDEAVEYLRKLHPKKYKLEFIDSKKMLDKSKEIESKKFKQILKDYYMIEL